MTETPLDCCCCPGEPLPSSWTVHEALYCVPDGDCVPSDPSGDFQDRILGSYDGNCCWTETTPTPVPHVGCASSGCTCSGFGGMAPKLRYRICISGITLTVFRDKICARNEIQRITHSSGTVLSGNFKLTFQGQQTGNIPFNATAAQVQTALEALSNIGVGDVACTNGPLPGTDIDVEFTGALENTNVTQMTVDNSGLVGASPVYAVSTVQNGQYVVSSDSWTTTNWDFTSASDATNTSAATGCGYCGTILNVEPT